MGLRLPDDPSVIVAFVSPYMLLELGGRAVLKPLSLNPKAPTLLPRHETPRSMEAVEKLVRNLSEEENCQFCWETPPVQTVESETKAEAL